MKAKEFVMKKKIEKNKILLSNNNLLKNEVVVK